MSRNELIAKIEALNEWEAMMEEAKTEADAIRSSIDRNGGTRRGRVAGGQLHHPLDLCTFEPL